MPWQLLGSIFSSVIAAVVLIGGAVYGVLKWRGEKPRMRVQAVDEFEQLVGRWAARADQKLVQADNELTRAEERDEAKDARIAEDTSTISTLRADLLKVRFIVADLLELADEAAEEAGVPPEKAAYWRARTARHRAALAS